MHYAVDSGILTFSNHGCNGTYNFGRGQIRFTEMNVNLERAPEEYDDKAFTYSPVLERHLRQIQSAGDYSLREIRAEDEILSNYVKYIPMI